MTRPSQALSKLVAGRAGALPGDAAQPATCNLWLLRKKARSGAA